ncbi:MAG TPA: GAF domain-containing protein, partial [Solirubrobacteraceae bacterium]|nr:GAF domain-containing protein [Solirubrobacteraceae bacterium]
RGRGVLGLLTEKPKPLRLAHVGDDPASYGFPAGHPPMDSFLGVPVLIQGEAWGNLYLTEKRGGAFDEADEEAVVVLARWAAIAVENARLYRDVEIQRVELERAVSGLRATQAVALAVGAEVDLERSLELIVERGRALVDARTVLILLREGDELVPAAVAGHGERIGDMRIPIDASTSGEVMLRGRSERIDDVGARLRISAEELGVSDAKTALAVPLAYRGEPLGVLFAFDHQPDAQPFSDDDEHALRAFAASAATAVVIAQSVKQQRLRDTLSAADAERRRWAQELHDETLQALGGLRVLLSSARRAGDAQTLSRATDQALEQIEQEITNLRAIITELRPAALDELGLGAALEALFERHRAINDLEVSSHLELPPRDGPNEGLDAELQASVYRVVQESLTNVAKHAHASCVKVSVEAADKRLSIVIEDDGRGFDAEQQTGGFGVTGMRERVLVFGGELSIDTSQRGTTVCAWLPLNNRTALP